MLDWEVGEEERALPDLPRDGPDTPARRRWFLWLGIVLLVAMLVFVLVRERLAEQEARMHRDLTTLVTFEERSRLFGIRENAASILDGEAPPSWRRAYLTSYEAPSESRAVEVAVDAIERQGKGALVMLRVAGEA